MTSGLPPFAATLRISVCMASYRGALYIEEQISSILQELGPNDELVIVDDASPDDTVEVIREFNDPRVRLIQNASNSGYVRTFEKAVLASEGEGFRARRGNATRISGAHLQNGTRYPVISL